MSTAGYDSKQSALYYPWIEVMDPISTRPPMVVPPTGHVAGVWCRDGRHSRRAQGAGQRGRSWAPTGSRFQVTQAEQGGLNKVGHQLHPLVPGPRHPDLGRAHAVERSGVALHQRPPALQLRRGVDHRGHAVERVRAQRPAPVVRRCASSHRASSRARGVTARCSASTPAEAFFVKCDAETNPPEVVEAGQVICRDRDRAGEAGRVRDLQAQPVQRRRRRGRGCGVITTTQKGA